MRIWTIKSYFAHNSTRCDESYPLPTPPLTMLVSGKQKRPSYDSTLSFCFLKGGGEVGRKFVDLIIWNACLGMKCALDNFLNYFVRDFSLVRYDGNRELKQGRRQRQRRRQKTMIWYMRKNNRAARAARTLVELFDVVCQWQREISKFKVLMTTWTHNSKSFILDVYFNGASTSPFVACSVNNKGCEEQEAIITK